MARENRRKRDERRFGKPERLADMAMEYSRGVPDLYLKMSSMKSVSELEEWMDHVDEELKEGISSPIINATNVAAYFCGCYQSKEFDCLKDTPTLRPPFSSCFIEFTNRGFSIPGYRDGGFEMPDAWGWIIHQFDLDGLPFDGSTFNGEFRLTKNPPDQATSVVFFNLVEAHHSIRMIDAGRLTFSLCLDCYGRPVSSPVFGICFAEGMPSDFRMAEIARATSLAGPAMLAIAFMNCKNVTLSSHHPEKTQNRERNRAGLAQFVRFHTINIEPMKSALHSEGDIESNGLKKALHICRGHFKTWTTTYMGRSLDKPVTYWTPSHVKGSAKEGVVISDYDVKAPK